MTGYGAPGADEAPPSAARVYDFLLGGRDNGAADRELGERFAAAMPGAREVARANRAFLRRAVEFLLASGIRQFLDVGSGIPTVGNVHEVAQQVDPRAAVVYVDIDRTAVAYSTALLEGNERAAAIVGDLRDPEGVLGHPETRRLLDLDQPLGLLMVGVLHFVPDNLDPIGLIARYRQFLAAGSFLVLSHFTPDLAPEEMAGVVEVMRQSSNPIHPRSRAQFADLFSGFALVEPGIVPTSQWRPDAAGTGKHGAQIYAGVGRLEAAAAIRK